MKMKGAQIMQVNPASAVQGATGLAAIRLNTADSRTAQKLDQKWNFWKSSFLTPDGFVKDPSAQNRMVSEGLGYGLLLAVALDDQAAFDKILSASQKMQKSNSLFKWRLEDSNSAADADEDIAMALILASKKWKNEKYLKLAEPIVKAIWENEVKVFGAKNSSFLFLMPSDNTQNYIKPVGTIINPSYFSPAWYRAFAQVDQTHDWNKLAEDTLKILEAIQKKFGEPIDWCFLTTGQKGEILVSAVPGNSYGLPQRTNIFGFDAVRVPLRLAFDTANSRPGLALSLIDEMLRKNSPATTKVENSSSPESWHNELVAAVFAAASRNSQVLPYGYQGEFKRFDAGDYYGEWDGAKNYYFNQSLALMADLFINGAFDELLK